MNTVTAKGGFIDGVAVNFGHSPAENLLEADGDSDYDEK